MYLRHLCGRFFRSSAHLQRIEHFVLPQPGEGIVEVEVTRWLVKPDAQVKEYEVLCEARSDKGFIEYKAPYEGRLRKIFYEESQLAEIGKPLYAIEVDDAKYPTQASESSSSSSEDTSSSDDGEVLKASCLKLQPNYQLTSPAVRHLAKIHDIDLLAVTPTGPKGRLLKCDVLNFIAQPKAPLGVEEPKLAQSKPVDSNRQPTSKFETKRIKEQFKGFQDFKISAQQRGMVKSMTEALKIPHLTYCDEVKMDKLLSLRQTLKTRVKGRLTLTPFFIKALSLAIKDFPIVNSSFVKVDFTEYKTFATHNVSIAIDTPLGLLVPNIKHCDKRSIVEIADELTRLQELAAQGRLSSNDLEGGTIALSNIGAIGGTYTRPIILPPQVVIGALGGTRPVIAYKDGRPVEESKLTVSWSADHRLIDGATVARFGNRWKELVEEPLLMLVHLK